MSVIVNLLRFILIFAVFNSALMAQFQIGTGDVRKKYDQFCMGCHGKDMEGGMGGSLLEPSAWKIAGKTRSFTEYVKEGNMSMGMPPFEGALTDAEIRSLEILILEVGQQKAREVKPAVALEGGVYSTDLYDFTVETVISDLDKPWSVAFAPQGAVWITEREGALRRYSGGVLHDPVEGLPEVWAHGQGGLMEVALHPDYVQNGWIYLSFSASEGEKNEVAVGMTKIIRGRVIDNTWMDEQVLFEAPVETHRAAGQHFGSRFVFQDGYLFFSIGDRGTKEDAQDLSRPNGKIHRIHDDGRIPSDNPFVNESGAYPSIWTYGNRNPQGLDLHPATGEIWQSEHGPRGGDEINLIERGVNYGWPVITYGMNYNGKPITDKTAEPGMAQPKHYWTPSIAVCGIDFYEGDHLVFPQWKHNLFVGGLTSNELHRLEIENGEVVNDEIVLRDAGRIRDVASGPDGRLYLVLNAPDSLVRLMPAP